MFGTSMSINWLEERMSHTSAVIDYCKMNDFCFYGDEEIEFCPIESKYVVWYLDSDDEDWSFPNSTTICL